MKKKTIKKFANKRLMLARYLVSRWNTKSGIPEKDVLRDLKLEKEEAYLILKSIKGHSTGYDDENDYNVTQEMIDWLEKAEDKKFREDTIREQSIFNRILAMATFVLALGTLLNIGDYFKFFNSAHLNFGRITFGAAIFCMCYVGALIYQDVRRK